MRELNYRELDCVSGGDWSFEADFGVVKWVVEGDESIQEIATAAAGAVSDAYWAARDLMADYYQATEAWYQLFC